MNTITITEIYGDPLRRRLFLKYKYLRRQMRWAKMYGADNDELISRQWGIERVKDRLADAGIDSVTIVTNCKI